MEVAERPSRGVRGERSEGVERLESRCELARARLNDGAAIPPSPADAPRGRSLRAAGTQGARRGNLRPRGEESADAGGVRRAFHGGEPSEGEQAPEPGREDHHPPPAGEGARDDAARRSGHARPGRGVPDADGVRRLLGEDREERHGRARGVVQPRSGSSRHLERAATAEGASAEAEGGGPHCGGGEPGHCGDAGRLAADVGARAARRGPRAEMVGRGPQQRVAADSSDAVERTGRNTEGRPGANGAAL
jgi:hypothetical protein